MSKRLTVIVSLVLASITSFAALVDADGNPATNETALADIDMIQGTVEDLKGLALDAITNQVVVGFTDWTYSGDIDPTATYNIMQDTVEGVFTFTLWNTTTTTQIGTITTNSINPLVLSYPVTGGEIVASRQPITRNSNGFAMYADVQALETKIDNMDTSYLRVVGLTNKNQSVQYVYADASVTELQIQMPTSGMTKDWIVYVLATSNIVLKLPPANYWCTSEAATNDIAGPSATALYFSQVNDDTYCIGRQEFTPVTVENPANQLMQAIKRSARRFSSGSRTTNKLLTK